MYLEYLPTNFNARCTAVADDDVVISDPTYDQIGLPFHSISRGRESPSMFCSDDLWTSKNPAYLTHFL